MLLSVLGFRSSAHDRCNQLQQRKSSHEQTFLKQTRSSKWSGVRIGTHFATRLSITPKCLVQCMPRRSLARLSLAMLALSRFIKRPSSVPKQKVFIKLLGNEFKFCCINACGDTYSLEYAKNASDRLKGTSVAVAFSKQWRSCVVLSCRIGSSLARYFLVKQGLSASRLTLCDSKVTHAPTVSPRGVSDHLFHGCHGQLGHMSLFMTSLLVIHECVAVQHFVLLSKGLIANF